MDKTLHPVQTLKSSCGPRLCPRCSYGKFKGDLYPTGTDFWDKKFSSLCLKFSREEVTNIHKRISKLSPFL